MIVNPGELAMSTSRKKLSPEESIAKAEAKLARAKERAAEQAQRAKRRAQAETRDASWAKRREAINFADDIVERVDAEVIAKLFPNVPVHDDEEDYAGAGHAASQIAVHLAQGLDHDGFHPCGGLCNPLSETLELEAFRHAAETFEILYRKALEAGIKTALARPNAERHAEVQAYLDKRAHEKRANNEWIARHKAEWTAAHPGEPHRSD
jgi:hypothetical protein